MSEKTKQLLESLGKIAGKPEASPEKVIIPATNMHYRNNIHKLPALYDKAKTHKDEDGEEFIYIDRVYGGLYGERLVERDGTLYKGKLYRKRRLIDSKNPFTRDKNRFYSTCTATADDRWFDNCGMPIEKPTQLEPEKVKTPEEIEEEKIKAQEKAKAKEAEILANLK